MNNKYFWKKEFIFANSSLFLFHDLLRYCNKMSEIIYILDGDNCDGFQQLNFIFSQKIISVFEGLFIDKIGRRVR
jgi:hypothetical protein